jgi:hypothetical protein
LVLRHGLPQSHLSPREFLPQSKSEHGTPLTFLRSMCTDHRRGLEPNAPS